MSWDNLHLMLIIAAIPAAIVFGVALLNPGYFLQSAGIMMNLVAIIANGMRMPFTADEPPSDGLHVRMSFDDMHFPYLCDILFGEISVGDVLIFGGLIVVVVVAWNRNHRSRRRSPASDVPR
jgi:hypothetical protein